MNNVEFSNPYRPGAGHPPPFLAGRQNEIDEFEKLLLQKDTILNNLVLTGLRGVGKTVLLETLKPIALSKGWRWVGSDLSESASITEENIAIRLITDLSKLTSTIKIAELEKQPVGFNTSPEITSYTMDYNYLTHLFNKTPGLVSDKLKEVLEHAYDNLSQHGIENVVFAYDEAQNLADHAERNQYPLSLLLDVFQSIQRKGVTFMLALIGLPTLFSKLVNTRTYSERMFRVVTLHRLSDDESREAITNPIQKDDCPIAFTEDSVEQIIDLSGGYPYFIQFICREVFDTFLQRIGDNDNTGVQTNEILRKLDSDFFAGRWARATDRQRELLILISQLPNCNDEFTVQEIVDLSKEEMEKPFSSSGVNKMLIKLADVGLVYKNRFGKYSFAVPLLGQFIGRVIE